MPLPAGTRLGPYEILAPIGAGGMGEVYRAHDSRLNRDVAIKLCSAQFSERFEREAKAIASLNHPNICQVYDIGPNYLVMEYIEGKPLSGPVGLDVALRHAIQIADALSAAHAKGIIHRDLKPGNIMVTAAGIKLLDFGLALLTSDSSNGAEPPAPASSTDTIATLVMTKVGTIVGTAAYMSPEQAEAKAIDVRSDIFSYGLVLYEMLSGRRAFTGDSAIGIIAAILNREPEPLSVPPAWQSILNRCLRKSPADRFQSVSQVRAALEKVNLASADKQQSIAVLPFANISRDEEDEYFSDGLAEEIMNALAQVPGLKVIARTSAFAFKGKNEDVRRIAETLGVSHVLEGSVRRAGNRLRVTAQLIHSAEGTQLWSQRFDRDMTDIFAVQDEISQAISEALQVRLAPRARAVNIEAYQHYLKAQYHRFRLTPESLAKAKEFYELALSLDPNFAAAYSGLAVYYYSQATAGIKPLGEVAPLAKLAAEKALALDPTNGDAHSALAAMAGIFDYDWKLAETHFRKAMAAEPVPPFVRHRYVMFYLLPLGRSSEAIEQSRMALETDPLSSALHFGMVWSLYHARQYREAIEYARAAIQTDPNFYFTWHTMGLAQMAAGLPQEAIASFERVVELVPSYHFGVACLAAAYRLAGDRERSGQWAQKLTGLQNPTIGAFYCAFASGDQDAMMDALEEVYRQRDFVIPYSPHFDPYHDNPRFQALLGKMNLV